MNILILGNGFDLAHDLKTTYINFLNYCIETMEQLSLIIYGYDIL